MHALRLTALDVPNDQFSLDFWLWFRWKDDARKPYETFELTNGRIDSRQIERVDKVGDVNYACLRVQATFTCFWNVARFPLGRQKLRSRSRTTTWRPTSWPTSPTARLRRGR